MPHYQVQLHSTVMDVCRVAASAVSLPARQCPTPKTTCTCQPRPVTSACCFLCLAWCSGHSCEHELETARINGVLGNIDANTGAHTRRHDHPAEDVDVAGRLWGGWVSCIGMYVQVCASAFPY